MSTVASALVAHIKADAETAAIVADRVEAVIGRKALPRITFAMSGKDRTRAASQAKMVTGLCKPRMRLVGWSKSYPECESIAFALYNLLEGFTGTLGAGGETLTVDRIYLVDELDRVIDPDDGSQDPIFGRECIFEIAHREAVPTG